MISSLIDFGHLALAVFEFENDIIGQSVGMSEIVHAYIIKNRSVLNLRNPVVEITNVIKIIIKDH